MSAINSKITPSYLILITTLLLLSSNIYAKNKVPDLGSTIFVMDFDTSESSGIDGSKISEILVKELVIIGRFRFIDRERKYAAMAILESEGIAIKKYPDLPQLINIKKYTMVDYIIIGRIKKISYSIYSLEVKMFDTMAEEFIMEISEEIIGNIEEISSQYIPNIASQLSYDKSRPLLLVLDFENDEKRTFENDNFTSQLKKELSRLRRFQILSNEYIRSCILSWDSDGCPALDYNEAINIGKSHDSQYVVFGNIIRRDFLSAKSPHQDYTYKVEVKLIHVQTGNILISEEYRHNGNFSSLIAQKVPLIAVRLSQYSEMPLNFIELGDIEITLEKDSKILEAYIDGVKVDKKEILTEIDKDGKLLLRGHKDYLGRIGDGAHSIFVKAKNGVRTFMINPINFWIENKKLKKYTDDLVGTRKYAVVIGVGNYNRKDLDLTNLPDSPKQARKLGKYLESLGYTVKYFLDDEMEVNKQVIEDYLFYELNKEMNPEKDELFFYFGGHGVSRKDFAGESFGYLLPQIFDANALEHTTISMIDDIKGSYARQLKAKHILFAIDACVASAGLRATPKIDDTLRIEFSDLAVLHARTRKPGRTIFTAGSENQPAIDKNGGIFTTALLRGLKGEADYDKNGVVMLDELHTFVYKQVVGQADKLRIKQEPSRIDVPSREGELVFFIRKQK